MNSQFRGGMQVHAVPEEERSYDAQGKRLPWAYLHADGNLNRKSVLEKGPFGRTTRNRRSISRSKTATPATKEDLLRNENHAYQDQLFLRTKAELAEQSPAREQKPSIKPSFVQPRLLDAAAPTAVVSVPAGPSAITFKEPTEVLLYGFAPENQYAAIEFFETISRGRIYEDYDRQPPRPRYNNCLSGSRSTLPRSLPRDAIKKINEYHGGEHWVKVTFDSPEAAELACHNSPHILQGYSVHAEPYRGTGPNVDIAMPVTSINRAGASTVIKTKTGSANISTTGFATMPTRLQQPPPFSLVDEADNTSGVSTATASSHGRQLGKRQTLSTDTHAGADETSHYSLQMERPLSIATAKRATLRPAAEALLPIAPWPQRALRTIPLLGPLFFGGESSAADVIGAAVPVTETGELDWDAATLWWKACWFIDTYLRTNLCGLKGE